MYVIKKWVIIAASITIMAVILSWHFSVPFLQKTQTIGMAVEFNDHAACAWIADEEGWYSQEGLELKSM